MLLAFGPGMAGTRVREMMVMAGAGAAGFAATATAMKNGRTGWFDWRWRRRLRGSPRGRARQAAELYGRLGSERVHSPLALAGAAVLALRGRPRAGAAVALASVGAAALSRLFERTMPDRFAPPGKRRLRDASFPSGHTLETASLAWVAAYVLAREGLARRGSVVLPAVLLPALTAASRIYLDRHWMSDVIGGTSAAVAYAASVAAAYETTRPTTPASGRARPAREARHRPQRRARSS